jgi:hypothetical protein
VEQSRFFAYSKGLKPLDFSVESLDFLPQEETVLVIEVLVGIGLEGLTVGHHAFFSYISVA